jgi:dihydroneopterin aldolase
MRGPRPLTVVKLGGSFAFSPHLKDWLDAIATCAGHVVLVPGGGPFADAVRAAQRDMGFDDRAAHRMALLAMEQYAGALANFCAQMLPADSTAAIRRALRERKVPVWCPARMVLAAEDVPWSWDATSDSLAAWLAGRLGAKRVLLVKQIRPAGASLNMQDFAAQELVDPLFSGFLAVAGAEASVAGAEDHAQAAAAIRSGLPFGWRIDFASGLGLR